MAKNRIIPAAVLIMGISLLYPLQRWIDATSPHELISEETLYFSSGETIKKMSLGLDGLVADIYWIRAVQYFGRKIIDSNVPLTASATRKIRMDLLAPFLNIIVTLDPQHIPAYRFGAIFLPERDMPAAISLLEQGIRANPDEWRFYQDLGYIYWQAGDYAKASEWYENGSRIAGAPMWMWDMAGLMKIRGGSREIARAIYSGYATSDDMNIRNQAIERLKQLQSLDELDAINLLLSRYKEQAGGCPSSLRVFAQKLHAMGFTLNEELIPLDPEGFPYQLELDKCQATLAINSTVPR